jgi:hypothetical protein
LRLTTGRLIDGAGQPDERLRQTRFDRSLLDGYVFGDLLQGHSDEAMEDEDIPTAARESADRPSKNPALAVFLGGLRWRSAH